MCQIMKTLKICMGKGDNRFVLQLDHPGFSRVGFVLGRTIQKRFRLIKLICSNTEGPDFTRYTRGFTLPSLLILDSNNSRVFALSCVS